MTLVKPKLRGVSHAFGAVVALPALIAAFLHAEGARATFAATIYGSCLLMLLTVSACYHVLHWPPVQRAWLRRLDHAAIYFLVAGTYTPLWLLVVSPDLGHLMFAITWGCAVLGALVLLFWPSAPRWINVALYLALGWIVIPVGGQVIDALGPGWMTLTLVGGVIYTVGALVYARRWPDPAPRVFGYHEIFHVCVLVAALCHFVMVWHVVGAKG